MPSLLAARRLSLAVWGDRIQSASQVARTPSYRILTTMLLTQIDLVERITL